MRQEYRMTPEQLRKLVDASKPVKYDGIIGPWKPRTRQQNAMDAWRKLGFEMGFNFMTAQPVPGKGPDYFTAEPLHADPRKKRSWMERLRGALGLGN